MRCIKESEVDIDVCDACESVWLDPGELNAIAPTSTEELGEPIATETQPCNLQCPRCNHNDFYNLQFSDIEIARCEGCGGVYLDSPALDQVKENAEQALKTGKQKRQAKKPRRRKPEPKKDDSLAVGLAADALASGGIELLISALFHF